MREGLFVESSHQHQTWKDRFKSERTALLSFKVDLSVVQEQASQNLSANQGYASMLFSTL